MQIQGTSPTPDAEASPPPGAVDVLDREALVADDAGPQPAARHGRARPGIATWIAAAGVAILVGSALFAGGFTLGRQTALTDGTPQALSAQLQPFWDAFDSIEQRYAGLPVTEHAVIEGAISGMFKALPDPFSMYLTGEAYRASLTGLSGQFEGIGAYITTIDASGAQGCSPAGASCRIAISGLIPRSPAAKAGLRAGDVILAVNGADVAGRTVDQVVALVQGRSGTAVTLRIERGTAAPFDVRLVRAVVTSVDVSSRLVANGTLGYIRISSFGSGVAADFVSQLRGLLADHVHGLVLDLRGNGGGFVDQARAIASQFIARGPIYWEQMSTGSRRAIDAEPGGIATGRDLPMIVLVDKGTASASEILAGALQDTGRARLMGTTTYGKGTIQEWQQLGHDMGGFRLTVARWLTPSRQWINGRGLTPNIAYTAPPSTPIGSDPELDRAIQLLTTDGGAPSTAQQPATAGGTARSTPAGTVGGAGATGGTGSSGGTGATAADPASPPPSGAPGPIELSVVAGPTARL